MGGHSWSIISTALVALLTVTMCDVTAQGFNNHFSGVPEGVAGVDYPNLTTIPRRTGFTCRDRKPGFYADPVTRCQAWHWCDTFLVKHTFLCPNLTVFNQRIRGCDWWYNVDCSLATSLYSNNDELYRDKDDDDYDETAGTNTNQLGSTKRPFINVEVHTTPRPIQHTVSPPPLNNLFNGAFGTSESIHSRVAVAGNSLRNDDVTTPFPVQDFDFQSTPEPFGNQFLQIKTIPPPFHSTPPPTAPPTTTPPTPTNNNRVIILAPTRHPSGFNFNIPNAIPIAFPTARPSSRFGPDPPPTVAPTTTTTTTPIPPTDFNQPIRPQPIVPVQPFDSQKVAAPADVKPTPGEFARADNGLTQGINLRRRLVSRVRGQKQLRQNGNGFAINGNLKPSPAIITTAASPIANTPQQQQPQLSSHVHFIAGDPNFNVAPPPTTDSNFAIEPTTFQDDGNRFFNTFPNDPATQQSNDFTDLPFTPTQNDELAVTTTHQQDFFTTENEFTPPQQAEDVTLQQQPITKPPVRSPKLVLLREPIQQQQPQFVSHTSNPQNTPPPPPPPPTSFFNAGIPYGARLRPVTTTSSDSNSLDNSGVFRRHDVFTSAAQNNATKVAAVSTSPTTVVVTTSNASFRKRKFLNGSNNSSTSKINTFPPFPVTTFSPKNGETFESTKQLKQEQAGSKRRKVPTAATVWFKIFPSSSTTSTAAPSTTTTTTTTEAPSSTTTTTTEVPRKSVPNKKSTTAITKKRRTFPSFPITTFKPRVHLTHAQTQSDGDFGERDEVTSSTTTQVDDAADTSTWSQFSTTSAQ